MSKANKPITAEARLRAAGTPTSKPQSIDTPEKHDRETMMMMMTTTRAPCVYKRNQRSYSIIHVYSMLSPGKREIGGTQASWGGVDGRLDGNPKRPVIYFSDTLGCSKCRKREREIEKWKYIFFFPVVERRILFQSLSLKRLAACTSQSITNSHRSDGRWIVCTMRPIFLSSFPLSNCCAHLINVSRKI